MTGVETPDDIVALLRALRSAAGSPSFARITQAVAEVRAARGSAAAPGRVTVYDCFRPGRRRLDSELVLDIVSALGVSTDALQPWREALRRVSALNDASAHPIVNLVPEPRAELVGRTAEFDRLAAVPAGTTVIVEGIAGVGKTELCLHVARYWSERLPDDTPILFADARGFDPHSAPLAPSVVIAQLLVQLGVPLQECVGVPAASLRERLHRLLAPHPGAVIVIDNVADEETVPLAGRARVLVTTRRRLDAGAVSSGWTTLELAPLAPASALALLRAHVGEDRLRAEPDAARLLVKRTGGLALDLTLVAASVAARPEWTLTDHAHRLDAQRRDANMRPALQLAYSGLSEPARRALRLIGVFPATRVGAESLAMLLGKDDEAVAEVVDALAREHLVQRVPRGGDDAGWDVLLHDAVAEFARQAAQDDEPFTAQRESIGRLLAGWVAAVEDAIAAEKGAWVGMRRGQLVATAALASRVAPTPDVLRLSELVGAALSDGGWLYEAEAIHRAAVESGTSDIRSARVRLGRTLEMQGRFHDAHAQLVLGLDPSAGDAERAYNVIGNVLNRLGRLDEAIAAYQRAIELAEAHNNLWTAGRASANLGNVYRIRGEFDRAAELFARGLSLAERVEDGVSAAIVMANQGQAARDVGDAASALRLTTAAIVRAGEVGYDAGLPRMESQRGGVFIDLGDTARALEALAHAERLASDVGQRDVLSEVYIQQAIAVGAVDAARAKSSLIASINLSRELGNPINEYAAAMELGRLARGENDAEQARSWFENAYRIASVMGMAHETSIAQEQLAAL